MINLDKPHRRLNILTGEWTLVSPHRAKRPWQGKREQNTLTERPSYDPGCYLCPGNQRASGQQNPRYASTYVFTNDFPALMSDLGTGTWHKGMLAAKSEPGTCKVICFSPDHSLTLADMEISAIEQVVQTWVNEYESLGSQPNINHVQIFENKGAMMGCSNPHPHGQIWAQHSIPDEVLKKTLNQQNHFESTGNTLLSDYLKLEMELEERVIYLNDAFITLVPFWAVWPYEAMIIPLKSQINISDMNAHERMQFADSIKDLTRRYDRLFDISFPYSAGIHQSPTDDGKYPGWHWHMSFYPPLLRSATVKKFMVGYEMFAEPQRDITAEWAADKLRSVVTK